MLSRTNPSSSRMARIESRPPGTQHSEAHSTILAICTESPVGNPNTVGRAAKMPVSQARPATITSTSISSALRNGPVPICPTILAASRTSCSVSAGMSSRPVTRPARTACSRISRSVSAGITAMRNDNLSVRAMSRIISSVASKCAAAPADPADPIIRGMSKDRAPCSTLRRSRRVASGDVAISPLPK